MAERLTSAPVVDRKQYAKRMLFVDKEGYVCVADRNNGGKKLSEEQVSARIKSLHKWKQHKKELSKQGSELGLKARRLGLRLKLDEAKIVQEKYLEVKGQWLSLVGMPKKEIYKNY